MKQLPKQVIEARTNKWLEVFLPNLLSHVPTRHRKVLADLELKPIEYPLQSTYLCGGVRTGKTVHAWQMLLQWHKEQYIRMLSKDFHFTSNVQMLSDLRSTYLQKTNTMSEQDMIQWYQNLNLLIIDDFGAEKVSEWAYQMMYIILNHRYDNEMTTIYTSNLTPEELSIKLDDDRLASRISHECKGRVILFNNKPYI